MKFPSVRGLSFFFGLMISAPAWSQAEDPSPKAELLKCLRTNFPPVVGQYLICSGSSETFGDPNNRSSSFEMVLPMWPDNDFYGMYSYDNETVDTIVAHFEGIRSQGFRNDSQPRMIHADFPESFGVNRTFDRFNPHPKQIEGDSSLPFFVVPQQVIRNSTRRMPNHEYRQLITPGDLLRSPDASVQLERQDSWKHFTVTSHGGHHIERYSIGDDTIRWFRSDGKLSSENDSIKLTYRVEWKLASASEGKQEVHPTMQEMRVDRMENGEQVFRGRRFQIDKSALINRGRAKAKCEFFDKTVVVCDQVSGKTYLSRDGKQFPASAPQVISANQQTEPGISLTDSTVLLSKTQPTAYFGILCRDTGSELLKDSAAIQIALKNPELRSCFQFTPVPTEDMPEGYQPIDDRLLQGYKVTVEPRHPLTEFSTSNDFVVTVDGQNELPIKVGYLVLW